MIRTWKLVNKKISELREFHKNPRRLTKEQYQHLCKSLDRFGIIDKPIITNSGMVIGGHQRLKALQDLGYTHIDCWVSDKELSDKEIEELCIRLNRNLGEFDFEILANEFDTDDLVKWGFDDLEFAVPELIENEGEENDKVPKNTKSCPACGHEF